LYICISRLSYLCACTDGVAKPVLGNYLQTLRKFQRRSNSVSEVRHTRFSFSTGERSFVTTANTIVDFMWAPLCTHTDMCRLATGIRSAKCVVRRFRRCANGIESAYTHLDSIGYYTL